MVTDTAVDRVALARLKRALGNGFARMLGYFREDAPKSIAAIEAAVQARDTGAIVRPAHTLKGEALQFGATPLGQAAQRIEAAAREALELHDFPDDVIAEAATLRPLFEATITVLDGEVTPATRAPGFGRRARPILFGRA